MYHSYNFAGITNHINYIEKSISYVILVRFAVIVQILIQNRV